AAGSDCARQHRGETAVDRGRSGRALPGQAGGRGIAFALDDRTMPRAAGSSKPLRVVVGLVGASIAARRIMRARRAFSLRHRCVLITGGSRGLGLELARQFAAKHARVLLCARDADELARARSQLNAEGIDARVYACDVTD